MTGQTIESTMKDAMWRGSFIVAVALVLSFVFNLLRFTGPLFMLLIYDRVLPARSEETLVALFGLVVVFVLLMGLIDYSRRRIMARFGAQFQERIETRLFTATSRNEFFARAQSKPTSGLDEVDGLRSFFNSGALISMLDMIWMPMFVVMVFVLHPMLGWLCLSAIALLVCVVLVQMLTSGAREDRAKQASRRIAEMKDIMVSSRNVIRGQEMGASLKQRWLLARQESRDRAIEFKDWTVWFDVSTRQMRVLLQYTVLAVGAYYALHNELTVGAMVAGMFLTSRVFATVESFAGDFPELCRAASRWRELKAVLAAKDAELADPNGEAIPANRLRLSLGNVSVKSPVTGRTLLRSVNMNVAPGKVIEIIGASGSGKTVLAETILGGWKLSAGSIHLCSSNISRLSEAETSRIYGYVPETVTFVAGTIEENISRLDIDVSRDKVVAAAKAAGIHDTILALPEGYMMRLDQSGTGFSRGDRYRLGLARALYNDPQILVIDEPDASMREALNKSLRPVLADLKSRGCIVLIFSRQRLSLPMTSGQLLLDGGRLKPFPVPENVTQLSDKKAEKKIATGGGAE